MPYKDGKPDTGLPRNLIIKHKINWSVLLSILTEQLTKPTHTEKKKNKPIKSEYNTETATWFACLSSPTVSFLKT